MIIVGSKALERFELNRKPVADIDRWWQEGEIKIGKEDDVVIPVDIYNLVETVDGYATPNSIYTIKCSHFAWDIKWEKTKNDILWLKANGCELNLPLYYALKKHWSNIHGNKDYLSLAKGKDKFFNDYVYYKYDHDYLHTLVSYPNEPMYKSVLKDNEEVLTDKDKFDKLFLDDKIRLFREEITVIAIERWLLSEKSQPITWFEAYLKALKKVIIDLTKNWASDFIIFNIDKFVKPDYKYFEYCLNKLEMNNMVDTKEIEEFLNSIYDGVGLDDKSVYFLASGGMYHKRFLKPNLAEMKTSDLIIYLEQTFGYTLVIKEGGDEGGSGYCYGVFELKGRFYKVEWSYYSDDGDNYDSALDTLTEVKPKQKLITVYE